MGWAKGNAKLFAANHSFRFAYESCSRYCDKLSYSNYAYFSFKVFNLEYSKYQIKYQINYQNDIIDFSG